MLDIQVRLDERLRENVDKIISGLLPHDNYTPELFSKLYLEFTKVIQPYEFTGEYFILISIFNQLIKLSNVIPSYKITLTKDSLNQHLNSNIYDLIRKPEVDIRSILIEEGLDINLETETGITDAVNILYTKVIDLYDKCFNMKIDTNECFSLLSSLQNELVNHVMERGLQNQLHILRDSLKIGRKLYAGPVACKEYNEQVNTELDKRLSLADDNITIIDSIDKINAMDAALAQSMEELAVCGIPPIDEETPMMTHWFRVVCAKEGVGKTMFAINSTVNLLLAGKRVVYMCGETDQARLFTKIVSNYICKKYNKFIDYKIIQNPNRYDIPEDILKLIRIAKVEIAESKNLVLVDYFDYTKIYNELKSLYDSLNFDAVVIDHTLALIGGSNLTERDRLDMLSNSIRRFKKEYPVFFLVLSHLSANASDDLRNGVRVKDSPTRGSSMLSKDADDLYVMHKDENLENKKLIQIQNYKRREATLIYKYMYIRSRFEVCSYDWDDELQGVGDMEISDANLEEMIDDINGTRDANLLDEFDDYDEDFDDFDEDYDEDEDDDY